MVGESMRPTGGSWLDADHHRRRECLDCGTSHRHRDPVDICHVPRNCRAVFSLRPSASWTTRDKAGGDQARIFEGLAGNSMSTFPRNRTARTAAR